MTYSDARYSKHQHGGGGRGGRGALFLACILALVVLVTYGTYSFSMTPVPSTALTDMAVKEKPIATVVPPPLTSSHSSSLGLASPIMFAPVTPIKVVAPKMISLATSPAPVLLQPPPAAAAADSQDEGEHDLPQGSLVDSEETLGNTAVIDSHSGLPPVVDLHEDGVPPVTATATATATAASKDEDEGASQDKGEGVSQDGKRADSRNRNHHSGDGAAARTAGEENGGLDPDAEEVNSEHTQLPPSLREDPELVDETNVTATISPLVVTNATNSAVMLLSANDTIGAALLSINATDQVHNQTSIYSLDTADVGNMSNSSVPDSLENTTGSGVALAVPINTSSSDLTTPFANATVANTTVDGNMTRPDASLSSSSHVTDVNVTMPVAVPIGNETSVHHGNTTDHIVANNTVPGASPASNSTHSTPATTNSSFVANRTASDSWLEPLALSKNETIVVPGNESSVSTGTISNATRIVANRIATFEATHRQNTTLLSTSNATLHSDLSEQQHSTSALHSVGQSKNTSSAFQRLSHEAPWNSTTVNITMSEELVPGKARLRGAKPIHIPHNKSESIMVTKASSTSSLPK